MDQSELTHGSRPHKSVATRVQNGIYLHLAGWMRRVADQRSIIQEMEAGTQKLHINNQLELFRDTDNAL